MKKIILVLAVFLTLLINCKNKKNENSENKKNISYEIVNKEFTEIVRQDNIFKLSCAEKYNSVKTTSNSLYLEIIEPTEYQIQKIENISSNEIKISLKNENFYYLVEIIDKSNNITYWKNYDIATNKIDEQFSFYTIENKNLKTTKLEKEICDNGREDLELTNNNINQIDGYKKVFEKSIDLNTDSINDKILVFKNELQFSSENIESQKSKIIVLLSNGNAFQKIENSTIFPNSLNDLFDTIETQNNSFTVKLFNELPNESFSEKNITFNCKNNKIVLSKFTEILNNKSSEKYNSQKGEILFEDFKTESESLK